MNFICETITVESNIMFDDNVSLATAVGLAWYAVLNSLQIEASKFTAKHHHINQNVLGSWHIILSIGLSASLVLVVMSLVNWRNILKKLSDSKVLAISSAIFALVHEIKSSQVLFSSTIKWCMR